MGDWTNATTAAGPTASGAGLLRPEVVARHLRMDRRPAGEAASAWVENHWFLAWDLPDGTARPSQVIAHPAVSLTAELADHPRPGLEREAVVVTGVATRRFDVELCGSGRVAGVKFRPGGLAALTGRPASAWTDRSVPAAEVVPPALARRLADPALVEEPAAWAAAAEEGLVALVSGPDPRYELLLAIVADMLADRSLVAVADVAARHGLTARTLQRLFLHYVGVGPKWVLARYRMHDAVAELDAGYDGTLGDLAHRLGWFDQAHFSRDFVSLVGVTPGHYRASARRTPE